MISRLTLLLFAGVLLFACEPSLPDQVELAYQNLPDKIDYNFHVKPILADRCYNCHGPDENTRKAGLRLDLEDEAFAVLTSGNKAFTRGSLKNSEVFHRIIADDPSYLMPPPDSKLTITPEEVAIISKWIEQGAEWKNHWAYQPIERPEIPDGEYKTANNEIDRFIQSELERQGLTPNDEADKERLLRRVSLDLTGLPPTIEEMDRFLADNSEEAYEKVVDRLLNSTEHAERLAMEWLDVARYSDSHGVSFDGYRNMWPYRDWVIEAFDENMRFDDFITKQVAGDLLPGASQKDVLATAFYRLNPMEASEGSIDEEYRMEYVTERTAMTGTAFMGLTVGCAKCHDHKFDAISQKEFYQLSAFFNNVNELGLGPRDLNRAPTLILLEDQDQALLDSIDNVLHGLDVSYVKTKNEIEQIKSYVDFVANRTTTGPVKTYGFEQLRTVKQKERMSHVFAVEMKKMKEAAKKKAAKKKKKDSDKKKEEKKKKEELEEIQFVDNNRDVLATMGVTTAKGVKGNGMYFDDAYDYVSIYGAPLFDLYDEFSVSTYIKPEQGSLSKTKTIIGNSGAYRSNYRGWELSLDSMNRLNLKFIHRLPDNYIEVFTKSAVDFEEWSQVGFTYDGTGRAEGLSLFINGKKEQFAVLEDKLNRTIKPLNFYHSRTDSIPLRLGKSYRLWTKDVGLFKGTIDELELYSRTLSSLEMVQKAGEENITEQMRADHKAQQNKTLLSERRKIQMLLKKKSELLDEGEEVMVMADAKDKRPTYILSRGLYDQYLEEVNCGTPKQVLPYDAKYPQNRLGLAMWLTDEQNPLTTRVTINRYWQMMFGVGLVKTTEDFGIQGDLPSNPELLDWLAAEFIASDWDLRHMLKTMVMSHTYRQSSKMNPENMEKDPENRFLSRANSYRLPAEVLRDNALAASGLLDKTVGGPSVKPYQPDGIWKDLGFFTKALGVYKQDSGKNLYRRSMYTFSRRFAPSPFMTNFDAPNREICITRRVNTNTPLQALNLLNDPQFVEASRCLSERAQEEIDDLDDQLAFMYRLSTGMKPNASMMSTMKDQYQVALANFEENPNMADSLLMIGETPFNQELDKVKTTALTVVANTLFNFDETYMKR